MTGVAWWSQTAATNASADPSVGWAEGMAPSSVNDSARAEMASVAKWRDDITGAIATGGTATAFTVASYQSFDNLARLNGQMIAFTPHTTSGTAPTLNVDGLGAKPLRSAPSVDLPAGVLIQGTPYVALYNSSDAAFYIHGFYSNPYSIPLGASIDFWGTTAPNSSFVLAYGQAISRTTYSSLFSMFSTTYGSGDGSTTFNIPDLRGRVVAGADNMGGSAAGRMTDPVAGMDGLGDAGGSQSHTLTAAQLPANIPNSASTTVSANGDYHVGNSANSGQTGGPTVWPTGNVTPTFSASTTVTINPSGGAAHPIVQPTIMSNKLLRII
jgi:microcystin-dependent protein